MIVKAKDITLSLKQLIFLLAAQKQFSLYLPQLKHWKTN